MKNRTVQNCNNLKHTIATFKNYILQQPKILLQHSKIIYCNIQKIHCNRRKQHGDGFEVYVALALFYHLQAHWREEGRTPELGRSREGGRWLRSRRRGGGGGRGLRSKETTYLVGAAATLLMFGGGRGRTDGGRERVGARSWDKWEQIRSRGQGAHG